MAEGGFDDFEMKNMQDEKFQEEREEEEEGEQI